MAEAPSRSQMTTRRTRDEWIHPLTALEEAPDGALAIASAAYIDQALELLLLSRFRDLTAEEYEWLFDESGKGVLAAPAAKIRVGYALGVYEKEPYSDMLLVNAIRNAFAHSLDQTTFHSESVYRNCRQFSILKRRKMPNENGQPFNARSVFYDAVVDLYVSMRIDTRGDLAWMV